MVYDRSSGREAGFRLMMIVLKIYQVLDSHVCQQTQQSLGASLIPILQVKKPRLRVHK